jgi:tripartite-type tricarboxylate transporter receptor subunit TctC
VQTFLESGESSLASDGWYGIFTTAGTPRPIIDRLATETLAFTRDPAIAARFNAAGMQARGSTPEELGRALRDLTAEFDALGREINAGAPAGR